MKSIIIAAPQSGTGKTTITLGLMECLKRRGLSVAPFKVGPDFIDPGYHRLVCGRPSINLDGWICPAEFVYDTFEFHSAEADIAVIEGVMGLFDGISGMSDQGSTAHLARIIGSPVILVVDARSQARSVAALIQGFAAFDPRVRVAGVIFNNVAGENHARILREALETIDADVKAIGFIPRDERFHIPSRHLGLLSAEENPLSRDYLDHLAEVIKDNLDFGLLWAVGNLSPVSQQLPFDRDQTATFDRHVKRGSQTRLAVARDEAFCFVYEDNLRLLREAGAELVPFSPLRDGRLPDRIGGIYLPGGYPELFADTLEANSPLREEIRAAIDKGMPVYAECGGFIYLSEGVTAPAAGVHLDDPNRADLTSLVGVFPVATRMLPRRKALGYREVVLAGDAPIGAKGTVIRGHEFHYSEMDEMPAAVERIYRVRKSGADLGNEGYLYKQCLASYMHLHFGSAPGAAAAFVASCRSYHKADHRGSKRRKPKPN
jgi:cobyrinic acid a,c-diamide synthase